MPLPWPWRRPPAAPTLPERLAAFADGARDPETCAALRQALRERWAPPVTGAGEADLLSRFVAAAASDRAFLLSLGGGFVHLADLARAAGAQPQAAAGLIPHAAALVEARPQLLEPALGLLSGAVPLDDLPALPVAPDRLHAALVSCGGAPGDADDPILDALASGDRARITDAVETLLRERGVAAAVERLRPWTPLLAPLALDAAGRLPPDDALRLAIVLDDKATAARIDTADPELAAAGAWTAGNRAPFARLFAGWAEAAGVAGRSLAGGDLPEMMGAFASPVDAPSRDERLVSVIMTVADPDPELLGRAIGSLLVQTHANWELLLVDDGGTAGSLLADQAARDPRIRLLGTQRNGGPYVARNLALREARGQAIAIHDSDDAAHPERLRAELDLMRARGLACVMSRALRVDGAGRLHLEGDGAVLGAGTMTALYDRAVFDMLGGFAPVRSRGDVEFLDRIARTLGKDAIETIGCPLMLCRAAPSTLSHRTRRSQAGALRLFRRAYAERRWWWESGRWTGAGTLTIPWGLKP